jgi:hypothetical protein
MQLQLLLERTSGLSLRTLSTVQKYKVLRTRGMTTMTTTSSSLGQGHKGVKIHTPKSPSPGNKVSARAGGGGSCSNGNVPWEANKNIMTIIILLMTQTKIQRRNLQRA